MRFLLIAVLFFLGSSDSFAERLNPEKYYQAKWCSAKGGEMEVILEDNSRVDCVTEDYAIEVDFADKWPESGFQALHYAGLLGLQPGVVLICEIDQSCYQFIERFYNASMMSDGNIRLWIIRE